MRAKEYPFVIDTYVETPASAFAKKDPTDPKPMDTDGRYYEFNYTLTTFT